MIIRHTGSTLLLITQPDHAALAGRIMTAWRRNRMPDGGRGASILTAISHHDDGWIDLDRAPIVDDRGTILDFVTVSDDVKQAVWPRAVQHLAANPYAAALVAQHALHIYKRNRENAAWSAFFEQMEAIRDRHLEMARTQTLDELLTDYFFVRTGDIASLTFCNVSGTNPPNEFGYEMRIEGDRLIVTPDPFDGREIPMEVLARELPDRRYASAADAEAALASARTVTITGVASGT